MVVEVCMSKKAVYLFFFNILEATLSMGDLVWEGDLSNVRFCSKYFVFTKLFDLGTLY